MAQLTLTGLYVYPVKSLAGIRLEVAFLDPRGLRHDRQWMLVDQQGEFLSQRRLPRMALIQQQILSDELVLRAPGQAELHLPLTPVLGVPLRVKIWDDICEAKRCGDQADAWFSAFLEQPCQLVYMPADVQRNVDSRYAEPADQTAFSDGFPLLLISEASLEELNTKLDTPVSMARFRPNLVVAGCRPYAEDAWQQIRIGELTFRVVKPCARCIVTTIDPLTAERGVEPLKTLSRYRRDGNKVLFGQNLLHDATGQLACGMSVEVLSPTN
jgi:uncharacterized protein YcbX